MNTPVVVEDPAPPPLWQRAALAPVRAIELVGAQVLGLRGVVEEVGRWARICVMGLMNFFIPPVRVRLVIAQCEFIGVQSLPIILLTSAFTGAVFTLQSYRAFALFQAESMVGGTVGVALTRELGPTLTGLLVTGRAGSAIAAELGSMRVTEQIDALDAMAVDPINYLVKPRLLASIIVMPLLTATFDFVGVFGSYVVGIFMLHMSEPDFMVRLRDWVDWDDIWSGLLKATVFGLIMGSVSCYKGFYTHGGAKGVGVATTTAVVVSSVAILVANFFIAWALP
ncbi:MAG TPA: ABC transporter permease [Myxococcota bacterium]|nr:ABC transporter permease [Myxococcota bacterium]